MRHSTTEAVANLRALLEGRGFDIGTRRQWKRGEMQKQSSGWRRIGPAKQPDEPKAPVSNKSPHERVLDNMAGIQKAMKESPLRGHLLMMGSMMSGNNPVGFKYGSFYEAVAKEGTPAKSEPLPADLKKQVMADIKAIKPEMKQCYYNAQKLVMMNPAKYSYVEGYASTGLIPIQHGWVEVKDGDKTYIIDPTLRKDHSKGFTADNLTLGEIPKGWEYLGRKFDTDVIYQKWTTGMAGSLYDWSPHYPFLREDPESGIKQSMASDD